MANDELKLLIRVDLSLFDNGDKTEQPTQKKKDKAREEGQVAKSAEVGTAFLILVIFSALKSFSGTIYKKLLEVFHYNFTLASEIDDIFNISFIKGYITHMFLQVIIIVMPMFAIAAVVGVITNLAQVGWKPTTKPLKPNFKRLNPLSGIKRLFSMQALIEFVKSCAKMILILNSLYKVIMKNQNIVLDIVDMELLESVSVVGQIVIDMGLSVGQIYLFIAALDFAYQKFKHMKDLKMTKQEVKEEYKQAEGNPQIKGAIKQKMREASMRRMMQDVKKADVIITNPTHYAIALRYDNTVDPAPVVLAKGADHMARRIREEAKEHNIEIVENKPLARVLYETCNIGKQIPPELYQAVAEILAFVYKLKQKI